MNKVSHIDGIVANTSALQIFYQSSALRCRYPLQTGRYKLEEGLVSIKRILSTYRAGLSDRQLLVVPGEYESCMNFEFDEWLMTIPEYTAHYLGYNILPGLGALKADGLDQKVATEMVKQYLDFVPAKLKNLDSIWLKLSKSKSYNSQDLLDMERVCDELLQFCEWMLSQIDDELNSVKLSMRSMKF